MIQLWFGQASTPLELFSGSKILQIAQSLMKLLWQKGVTAVTHRSHRCALHRIIQGFIGFMPSLLASCTLASMMFRGYLYNTKSPSMCSGFIPAAVKESKLLLSLLPDASHSEEIARPAQYLIRIR